MPPRSSRFAIACTLAALAASAFVRAQSPAPTARKALLGSVRDSAGAPVANATVTLWGIRSHVDPTVDRPDEVIATTDARGRFHARVLPELPYCGYALANGEPGTRAASPLRGWFGAGANVEFALAPAAPPLTARAVGGDEWRALGALTWSLLPALGERALGPVQPFAFAADGGAPVHELGRGRSCIVEARTAAGELLWASLPPAFGSEPIALPRPRELTFCVRDEREAPLANAVVRVRVGYRGDGMIDGIETTRTTLWRELGRTDANGRLTAAVPLARDPFADPAGETMVFVARADGRAEVASGFLGNQLLRDDCRVSRDDVREVAFHLPPVPVATTMLQRGAQPLAGARLRVLAIAKQYSNGGAFVHDLRHYEAVAGADGRATLVAMPNDLEGLSEWVLPAAGERPLLLPPRRARELLPTIDAAEVGEVRLQLFDQAHGPFAGRAGYVRAAQASSLGMQAATRFCTDGAGICTLLLAPGDWHVFADHDDGFVFDTITVERGRADEQLSLQPYGHCRGVLRDERGAPVVGARVVHRDTSAKDVATASEALRTFVRLREEALIAAIRTGADGTFDIPFVPINGLTRTVQLGRDGKRTVDISLESATAPLELKLQ